jgi:hypothetical protein
MCAVLSPPSATMRLSLCVLMHLLAQAASYRASGNGWTLEADWASNALFYTYVTTSANCSGYLNVRLGARMCFRSSARSDSAC